MKRIVRLNVILILLLSFIVPVMTASAASGPQTYTVLVGAENVSRGIGMMAYYPATLRIHVGDTVVWQQNSNEIHTVTFLAGESLPNMLVQAPGFPPGAMMVNPEVAFPVIPSGGQYDGSSYANSGIMSNDPGNPTQFSLTFNQTGTFSYECAVHGQMMSGTIIVTGTSEDIPSPEAVSKDAQQSIVQDMAHANVLFGMAMASVPKPVKNPDGSTSYTVLIGYSQGQTDLMSFFPDQLPVHVGDTVNFVLSNTNDAPHTITFLNGNPDIPFITPVPNPPGPPLLLFNPEVAFPINPGQPLTRNGVYSSGLLQPGGPSSYSFKIGNISGSIDYECLLHDTSGMEGSLQVNP